MKNLFDCKDEKITEKVFSQSLAVSVLSILLCLVALCSTTWAWFTTGVSSANSTIKSGCFDFTVKVNGEPIPVSSSESGVYTCDIPNGQTYEITLTPTEETNTKGYCAIKVNDNTARTAQFTRKELGEGYTLKLKNTTENDVAVTFEVRWGIAAQHNVEFGKTYAIGNWSPISEGEPSGQNP